MAARNQYRGQLARQRLGQTRRRAFPRRRTERMMAVDIAGGSAGATPPQWTRVASRSPLPGRRPIQRRRLPWQRSVLRGRILAA